MSYFSGLREVPYALVRHGLALPMLIAVRDGSLSSFAHALIGGGQLNLGQGPDWFTIHPQLTIDLKDPNS